MCEQTGCVYFLQAASVGSIEKPLSDEGDAEKREREREKEGEEEEDASHLKKKKSSESDDDDEPPPPYSKTDPQEDKFEEGRGGRGEGEGETSPQSPAEPEEQSRTSAARKLATESSSTSDSDSRSAASLSRVSSPIRGKTLSDLTRITPEDTASLQPPDSTLEAVTESQPESLSLSDTTLVNSQELGTMNLSPPTPEVGAQRSDEPKLVLDGGKRIKRKGKRGTKDRSHSSQAREAGTHLVLNNVQLQGTVSSQESNLEGLSPEMSDYGEHSNETESEPREIRIRKGGHNLGMSLAADDKNACIVVKNVASNGAVGRDGRIRVGDRIIKINGKSLDGVSLTKAKTVLKRASARSEELTITYVPVPQVQNYTMPPYSYKPSSRSVPGSNSSVRLYPSLQHQLATIRGTPLHDIAEQDLPGGGQTNIQMTPHGMLPPHTQLTHNPQMMHQTSPPTPQWQQGVSPYQPPLPGTSNITPMQVTGSYLEQATSVGQPLPPYVYLQQPPGMMAQTPPQPGYPQPPPPQPMAWNMQQQIAMGPPLSQASPMASWGVNVMHREPPQYDELMVQQQRIRAQQYQLPSPMQQQAPQHQMQQNNRMNKSQSESKFHSGMTQRPQVERRHNSQGLPSVIQPLAFRLQQQHDNSSFEEQQRWSHELSHGPIADGVRSRNTEMGKTHLVELVKDHTGSLGLHVGQLGGEGGPSGVVVASVLPSCQAFTRRKPKRGDQILEVGQLQFKNNVTYCNDDITVY